MLLFASLVHMFFIGSFLDTVESMFYCTQYRGFDISHDLDLYHLYHGCCPIVGFFLIWKDIIGSPKALRTFCYSAPYCTHCNKHTLKQYINDFFARHNDYKYTWQRECPYYAWLYCNGFYGKYEMVGIDACKQRDRYMPFLLNKLVD